MTPTIGRIVIYKLTAEDAIQINRRRTTGEEISERIKHTKEDMQGREYWHLGAQAHIGLEVSAGQEFPMVIVRVNGTSDIVNGQVLLDGNDVLWKQSVREVQALGVMGCWHWPERV